MAKAKSEPEAPDLATFGRGGVEIKCGLGETSVVVELAGVRATYTAAVAPEVVRGLRFCADQIENAVARVNRESQK